MSMKYTSKKITICEILREINDLHQTDNEHDLLIRQKLSKAEHMAKRMTAKLVEYKQSKSDLFPDLNVDYKLKKKNRKNKGYKSEIFDGECEENEI